LAVSTGPLVGGALVDALIRGNEEGWGSALIVSCFTASALLLVLFVVAERRTTDPLLDLTLFRKPAFTGATIVGFALSASIFSMFLYRSRLAGGAARRPGQGGGRRAPRVRDWLQHDRDGDCRRGGGGLRGRVCAGAVAGLRGPPGAGSARACAGVGGGAQFGAVGWLTCLDKEKTNAR
jgi:hypothetical protein